MCTKPLTINGYEVSCRECDECVATYKNSWVSRCVAEKQTFPHAYAVTLTYADVVTIVDGQQVKQPPLGARVYRYKDVSDFWKRLRYHANKKWQKQGFALRYVVVGEKGTKEGRCHYHGVLFATHPIHELGELEGKKTKGFAYKRRLNWTLWGHGYVEFQRPDRAGMAYVLKYILKARMTAARSRGFAREGKTEWLASSYLWCSKKPAIGSIWLFDKLNDLVSKGMCPPALRVRVPGGGDWYVHGKLQKDMCLYLHHANAEFRKERGRDLAGWSTLINSVSDEIEKEDTGELVKRKPWEYLIHGEEAEEEISEQEREIRRLHAEQQYQRFKAQIEHKRRIAAPIESARATVRNCGHIVPCANCAARLYPEEKADFEQEYILRFDSWQQRHPQGSRESASEYERRFKDWWLTRLYPSRGCALRETEILQGDFRSLVAITKAQPGLTYKGAVGKGLQGKA
jgi:hypothetical protein